MSGASLCTWLPSIQDPGPYYSYTKTTSMELRMLPSIQELNQLDTAQELEKYLRHFGAPGLIHPHRLTVATVMIELWLSEGIWGCRRARG